MHEDLLSQAKMLARADKGRPKQVNLRRAVSAAYYAYFHYLTDEACRSLLGTRADVRSYRHAIARAFDHSQMRRACESFAGGTLPKNLLKTVPALTSVPPDLRIAAAMFVRAPQKRHWAEYAPSERFKRSDVESFIDQVEWAILLLDGLPDRQLRKFFLVCLLVWENLRRP